MSNEPVVSSQAKETAQSTMKESVTQQTTQQTTQQATQHENTQSDGIKRVNGIIVVNKKYALPKDYNPGENPTAKQAFLKLKKAMQDKGFAVGDQYSGFRSYTYQEQVYNDYVRTDGKEKADRYSARPGHSEHQTGLAFDFTDATGQLLGDGVKHDATEWLAQHAHEYGFIVRYLPGKEHITGYMAEAWHVRYVGEVAEEIYRSGLTLEEYLHVDGGDYAN
ncbi:M15 family metallopeptidase [Carnobacteriaceae bacterium zg-ZUI252]|nr:M15 family metallopeptidase [Carnobacteriaceae bacterium zg-ZUI252]